MNKKEDKILESCEVKAIHQEVVDKVQTDLPDDEVLYDLAELFKVFGDSTRIKILYSLFQAEMCVCDIGIILGISQSAVSHQLRVLKQARLVKYRREGKVVYYSLDDDHIKRIFNEGLNHIKE
ncbi:ArsR/SmtB family transcription factor [Clostridium mediterraneense]|uniref:ArsR/SmtB family transcription factor n=1 Tax=Clostridium mediterraneense TaxID=1805472 RepID=UPI0008350891|nr:metalloregulator ArsR/SmtB family transcription factor [Clostridium mediterraneense]